MPQSISAAQPWINRQRRMPAGFRDESPRALAIEVGPLVYFIRTTDRLVKIGTSTNVIARASQLRLSPYDILAFYPGSYDEEAAELARFRQHVVRGNEYHAPHDDLFDRIDEIRASYDLSPVRRWALDLVRG